MAAGPLSRLARALFIVLVTSGGGELPALDAVLFHSGRSVAVTVATHVESGGGCHADQCAIRATAHHPPVTPTVVGPTLKASEPSALPPAVRSVESLPTFPSFQPFSRAPPVLLV